MVVVMVVMILVMPFSHDDQYVMTLASSISVIVLETSDHLAAAC